MHPLKEDIHELYIKLHKCKIQAVALSLIPPFVNQFVDQSVSAIDASEWYTSNFLKGNVDKYRILMLGSKLDNNINIVMDDIAVTSTDCLELLGVSIDRNLRFDEHV